MKTGNDRLEKIRFRRFDDMRFLELMSVADTRRHFSAFHESYTICANMTRGGAEWRYRGKLQRGEGKMLMLMQPGEAHRTQKLIGDTGSFNLIHLAPSWIENAVKEAGHGGRLNFSRGLVTHRPTYDAMLSFLDAAQSEDASQLERESRLLRFLELLFLHGAEHCRESGMDNASVHALGRARDYLADNYEQKILLGDLARVAGLTKFHLLRSFTRRYGLTPHAFLTHVRISKARAQLQNGRRLTGVELGFYDQSHFIRAFGKIVGTTPTTYALRR
jgi:AraC-like DNA-binding protein